MRIVTTAPLIARQAEPFDCRRALAAAIAANLVESFFKPALLNRETGRVTDGEDTASARAAVADRDFMDALFSAMRFTASTRSVALARFSALAEMRDRELEKARRGVFLTYSRDRTANTADIKIFRNGARRTKGIHRALEFFSSKTKSVAP